MTLLQALILGIVQGITEFLPISSSGHLVLVPHLLGWEIPADQAFVFDVLVQMGTLVAVIAYFWDDLWGIARGFLTALAHRRPLESAEARLGWYLIVATLPAVVAGLLFKDAVEAAFASPKAVGYFLWGTAALLLLGEAVGKRTRNLAQLHWADALIVGLFQVLALFPGVSRSGSTITGGMVRHFDRPTAARFSFLMSVPVMAGAGVVALKDMLAMPAVGHVALPVAVGFLAALVSGYAAIRWLLRYLGSHNLLGFALYCVLVGGLILWL